MAPELPLPHVLVELKPTLLGVRLFVQGLASRRLLLVKLLGPKSLESIHKMRELGGGGAGGGEGGGGGRGGEAGARGGGLQQIAMARRKQISNASRVAREIHNLIIMQMRGVARAKMQSGG